MRLSVSKRPHAAPAEAEAEGEGEGEGRTKKERSHAPLTCCSEGAVSARNEESRAAAPQAAALRLAAVLRARRARGLPEGAQGRFGEQPQPRHRPPGC